MFPVPPRRAPPVSGAAPTRSQGDRAAFAGRFALKTWLTAILKNKIVDLVRQRARTDRLDLGNEDEGACAIASPDPQPHGTGHASSCGAEPFLAQLQ